MKQVKGRLVPKLRFREFEKDGDWEESNIGSLGNFYYGKSAPKWSLEKNAPTPCVRYGELYTKYGPIITKTYSRTNIKTTELKFSKGGEILIPRVGEKPEDFGKNCCYLPLKNIAIGEMISVFETQQNPLFYTYYFRSIYKEFAKVVEGQNVKNLYYAELEPLTVFRPLLPEQQKIADCLSSLDELIDAEDKKLEALQRHKKGLMQELFPAEGQTLPKRRFPEFQNSPEWEEKQLSEIADYENGKAHEQDISDHGKYVVVNSKFISTEGSVRKFTNEGRCLAEKGEILMVLSDVPDGRAIAKCFLIDENNKYTVNQRICRIKPRENVSGFIFCILNRNEFYLNFDDGVKQTNLRREDVLDCPIFLPTKKEQQRIADFLSSIDNLITAQTKKLDSLRLHKKGLMQQLFPNPDN